MSSSGPGHLDPSTGREVVYCHNCANEWYNDEHGLQCPRCRSEICEIIAPDNDPRSIPNSPESDTGNPFGPHGFMIAGPRHVFGHVHNHDHDHEHPDPDEMDIEDDSYLNLRSSPFGNPRAGQGPGGRPLGIDPASEQEIFERFQDTLRMLMGVGGGGRRPGTPGRTARDTLLGPGSNANMHTRTFASPGGRATFSFTTTVPNRQGVRDFGHDHDGEYDAIFGTALGGGGVRAPTGNPVLEGGLRDIFSLLLAPGLAGPNAVHGDAVYSQEALDRIITQLMEAHPQSNAAPPATEAAIENLEKKKIDKDMMGESGKAECTICIDEMQLGDEVTVLPCKHWFHGECVVLWLKEHNTCPICRSPIEKRDGNGGNGENGRDPDSRQGGPSDGGLPSISGLRFGGLFHGPAPWESGAGGGNSTSADSEHTRGARTPEERRRRLDAIRNLAGASTYGQASSDAPRYGNSRRDSWSPTSPPPTDGAFSRDRSPARPRPNRENSFGWNSQRSSRSSNNSGGNSGLSNPLSWIRDRFAGGGSSSRDNGHGNRES